MRNSYWAMLGIDKTHSPNSILENIREQMLKTIEKHCGSGQTSIEAEIVLAVNIASLWYLRPKMIQVISAMTSELIAEREMRSISELFVGHYP
jgi:hypothetical protein